MYVHTYIHTYIFTVRQKQSHLAVVFGVPNCEYPVERVVQSQVMLSQFWG
jgi:hypothetical protein